MRQKQHRRVLAAPARCRLPIPAHWRTPAAVLVVLSLLGLGGLQEFAGPEEAGAQTPGPQAGRVLVNGHGVEVTSRSDFVPVVAKNVAGHRSILQKSISWVSKAKSYPRLLYVTQYNPDQLEGAGFPECSSPMDNPALARGCLQVSYHGYDDEHPCEACRDSAHPNRVNLETVNFADYDAVIVSNATTQWQVDVLNRRAQDVVSYINSGGGWLQFPEEDNPHQRDEKHEMGFLCLNAFDVYVVDESDRDKIVIAPLGEKIGLTRADVYQEGPLEGGAERIQAGEAQDMFIEQAFNDAYGIGALFKRNGAMDYESVTFLSETWWQAHIRGMRPAIGKDLAVSGPLPACGVSDTVTREGTAETTEASFVLTVPSGHYPDLKFRYETEDGTAIAGRDYQATRGEVVFKGQQGHWTYSGTGNNKKRALFREPAGPGEYQKVITVPILNDAEAEPEENFFLKVTFIDEREDCLATPEKFEECRNRFDTDPENLNPWSDHYPAVWGMGESGHQQGMNATPYIFPGRSLYLPKVTGVGKIVDAVAPPDVLPDATRPPKLPDDVVPKPEIKELEESLAGGGIDAVDRSGSLTQQPPPPPSQPQPHTGGQSGLAAVEQFQPAALQPEPIAVAQAQANLATAPQVHVQTQAQVQAAPMMQKQREIEIQVAENKPASGEGKSGGWQASRLSTASSQATAASLFSMLALLLGMACSPRPRRQRHLRPARVVKTAGAARVAARSPRHRR